MDKQEQLRLDNYDEYRTKEKTEGKGYVNYSNAFSQALTDEDMELTMSVLTAGECEESKRYW